jgi:hypothetical protein
MFRVGELISEPYDGAKTQRLLFLVGYEVGYDARPLPNLYVVTVHKLLGGLDSGRVIRCSVIDRRAINVAVFTDQVKPIFGHSGHPRVFAMAGLFSVELCGVNLSGVVHKAAITPSP